MLGVVCTAAGYIIYFRLIADIGPLRSLSVTFLIPPFAALWGYLCLGGQWRKGLILGALLVCVALWMMLSCRRGENAGTGRRMMHRPADSLRETASRRRRLRAAPPGCLQ